MNDLPDAFQPRLRQPVPLDGSAARDLRRAARLCWWSLALLGAVTVLMYAAMGGSQAMQTALIEDVLSLVPPAAFLVAMHFRTRGVDRTYSNGRERAFDITFLASSVALTGVGILLVLDASHVLLTRTHPVVGTVVVGDTVLWQGWLMIGALAVSAVPPVILGHMKLKLALALSSKPLYTDADMNKADWMTALAGIAGIVGIGFGLWWADAAAAIFIAIEVLRDGVRNLRNAVRDLHDARPQRADRSDHDPLPGQVCRAVGALDGVLACEARFHEEGLRLAGVVFVRSGDGALSADLARRVRSAARDVHWRIDDVTVAPLEDPLSAAPDPAPGDRPAPVA